MIGLLAGLIMSANINMYPRAMEIVEVHDDIAICVDAVGYEWEFTEPEDLIVGDLVICMMDTKGTETIFDDEITHVYYSGYTANTYKPDYMRVIDI